MSDLQRDIAEIEWLDRGQYDVFTAAPPTPPTFEFRGPDNKPMVTIRHTGEVELAPGLEISEASRLFWQGLADAFPAWRAEVIAAALAQQPAAADVTDEYARAFHDGWLACKRGDAEPPVPAPPAAAPALEAVAWQVTVVDMDNTGTHDYAKWAGLQALPTALGGQVPVAWPKADDSARAMGWTWDYRWIESLADATRAAGWDASMEAIDFLLSRLAARRCGECT